MIDAIQPAIIKDSLMVQPSDDEVTALFNEHGHFDSYKERVVSFARDLLAKYGAPVVAQQSVGYVSQNTSIAIMTTTLPEASPLYAAPQPLISVQPTDPNVSVSAKSADEYEHELDELGEQCCRLQNALAFYMPNVPEIDHPLHKRIAHDAYLLFGYDGNSGEEPSAQELGFISLNAQPSIMDDMVSRFLGWRFPDNFSPDCGVSFKPLGHPNSWPTGTNLLNDPQARAMLEYVIQGAPVAAQPKLSAKQTWTEHQAFRGAFQHLPMEDGLSEGVAAFVNQKTQGAWEGWQARAALLDAAHPSVPDHLIERLRKHCDEKDNTAFARSSMREALEYLAPTPLTGGQAQQDADDLDLDRLSDHIADNWPDKKYTLEEICTRLHATWPAAFQPAQAQQDADMVEGQSVNATGEQLYTMVTSRFKDGSFPWGAVSESGKQAWASAAAELMFSPGTIMDNYGAVEQPAASADPAMAGDEWLKQLVLMVGQGYPIEEIIIHASKRVQPASGEDAAFNLVAHLYRQRAWSESTFGPGCRTQGVIDHIRKELLEIEADPCDIEEWIDVAILALDGAWRSGSVPEQIVEALATKQAKNESRVWPDWRTMNPNKAIEHDRSADRESAAFYISVNHWAVYVKEGDFFREQGGLREKWGTTWIPVSAGSIEEAREVGKKMQQESQS